VRKEVRKGDRAVGIKMREELFSEAVLNTGRKND